MSEKISEKISKSIAQIIRENEELAAENKALKSQLAEAQEDVSAAEEAGADVAIFMVEEKDKEIARLTERLHNAVETADRLDDELCDAREEVTRLKAKIYDLEHPEE